MTPEFRLRPARLSCVPCSSRLTSFPVGVVNQQPRSELRHRPRERPAPRPAQPSPHPTEGPVFTLLRSARQESPRTPHAHPGHGLSGSLGSLWNTHPDSDCFASLPPLPGLIRVVEDIFMLLPSTLSCCPFLLTSLTHACFLLSPELSGRTPASERLLLGLPLTQNALSSRRLLGRLPPMLQVFVYISHWRWESPLLY